MSEIIRLSLDTEFNEEAPMPHWTGTDFISIGLVNIDQDIHVDPLSNIGFYAVSSEFNQKAAEDFDFVREHVLPKLYIDCFKDNRPMTEANIAEGVKDYIRKQAEDNPQADTLELWALNKTTDAYLFAKMFRTQMRMKRFLESIGIKHFVERDLKELKPFEKSITAPKPELITSKYHNSFYDACHQAQIIQWVKANTRPTCTETAAMDAAVSRGLVKG